MKTIGITGNIGSGKSTVAEYIWRKKLLVKKGSYYDTVTLIDADQLAGRIIGITGEALNNFGEGIFVDGFLNKEKLFNAIYKNSSKNIEVVQKFNRWIHNLVEKEIRETIDLAEKHGVEFAIISAALLFEARISTDYLVLVTCDNEVRQSRLAERNKEKKIPNERTKILEELQFPQEIMRFYCDFEIDNSGSFGTKTVSQLSKVAKQILGGVNEQ